ncbi:MAG: shikimate dehydrogenase [Acidimicrobiales bacterium]
MGDRRRLAAVIGQPVAHSRSPAIHNAAFAATGLNWTYVALEVAPNRVPQAIRGMAALGGFDGMSITHPHKQGAAREVDRASPDAVSLGVINTVVREADGRLRGENTDGTGLVASLLADDFDPGGRRCVILGAGGSARAIARALSRARAADVAVVNRTRANAIATCAFAGPVGRVGQAEDVERADLVINATPIGMTGGPEGLPVEAEHLHSGQMVVDLIYEPEQTALLVAAAGAGARTANGLGMLVHQAAAQFLLWTGVPAPLSVMWGAAQVTEPAAPMSSDSVPADPVLPLADGPR